MGAYVWPDEEMNKNALSSAPVIPLDNIEQVPLTAQKRYVRSLRNGTLQCNNTQKMDNIITTKPCTLLGNGEKDDTEDSKEDGKEDHIQKSKDLKEYIKANDENIPVDVEIDGELYPLAEATVLFNHNY